MPVSQTWLTELDQKIQNRQTHANESIPCSRNKSPESRKKYYLIGGGILIVSIIVITVCFATIDYKWGDDEEDKHEHHDRKDSVNLSVKVDVSPDRSSLQPIEMTAPEGVHRDMAFDHPGAQYFAGPVKVMSDEERIRYERMMNPVPKTMSEFMDNQKFVFHVMDFSNLMPPAPRSSQQQSGASLNQNQQQEEDDDEEGEEEDQESESDGMQPSDRSFIRTPVTGGVRIIPSDFLTQQFLDSVSEKDQSQWSGSFSNSPGEPRPRRGHTNLKHKHSAMPVSKEKVGPESSNFLSQMRQKQAPQLPVKEKNLDELFVEADRNIAEITQMKQTADFFLASIGRMLAQKAQSQKQQHQNLLTKKPASSVPADKAGKKIPENKVAAIETESKLDHLLDVADQDISRISQKTNQTDKLMALIAQILSPSVIREAKRKRQNAKTLEEKELPDPQLTHDENFPFLPFFSPISIQRKEHDGQPFGTEKPGYLFLGKPVVGSAAAIESSTDKGQELRPLPAYSLLQTPRFNGKPLDDHPDDQESGDVDDDDANDEDEDDFREENASTDKPLARGRAEPVSIRSLIREKRISRPAMY